MWKSELLSINQHYNENRLLLKNKLETKFNQDFSDIIKQKGMFYYSKLSTEQVLKMREKGIYFPDDGRISIGGINVNNIDYIVDNWSI
jgi:aspartate/tyrosine/aromatic aminotransferase